ncbi:hypothetical protein [Corynebacterium sp. HMSC077B05]|uniref:hypothetical protein n=1 Tax=Corynebacterium sp. HMSC077B05 TaxID=1739252 RepID=UPI0008A300B0|nr:hypothetical protein [Corynebacterium sp. HMSC077B05]OFL77575.1 hypothetical protein HMPREF2748_03430 [Corynebacterium sp. HMSC077B05]
MAEAQGQETDYSEASMEQAANQDVKPQGTAVAKANNLRHPNSEPETKGSETLSSPSFLMSFTRWHPAVGSFQWLADCQYPRDTMPAHERFNHFRDDHKWLYWTAVIIDVLVMLVVLVLLGIIAARVIYITLWQ